MNSHSSSIIIIIIIITIIIIRRARKYKKKKALARKSQSTGNFTCLSRLLAVSSVDEIMPFKLAKLALGERRKEKKIGKSCRPE